MNLLYRIREQQNIDVNSGGRGGIGIFGFSVLVTIAVCGVCSQYFALGFRF